MTTTTAKITRPTSSPDDTSDPLRHKVATASTRVAQTQNTLNELRTAHQRARDAWFKARTELDEAQSSLTRAEHHEPSRKVTAFINNSQEVSPIPRLTQKVESAQAQVDHYLELQGELERSIATTASTLEHRQTELQQAVGLLLEHSPQLHALDDALWQTWARLRAIRTAFAQITNLLPHRGILTAETGAAPRWLLSHWESTQPTDAGYRGFDTDLTLAEAWQRAIQRLLTGDPHAPLPDSTNSTTTATTNLPTDEVS